MNKELIDLGRIYRVMVLAGICGVNYLTALNWVQLGEMHSVKIGRTYLITGERIQDRLNQKFYCLIYLVGILKSPPILNSC